MDDWGRLLTCLVTPFQDDFQINVGQALRLAEAAAMDHSDAVVVGDEAGEGSAQSLEERVKLFRIVRDALLDKSRVIAATSGASTTETVLLTRAAEQAGVDGVILTPPVGLQLSQEAIYQHLFTVIRSTALPVMVRTDWGLRGFTVSAAVLERLAALPNLVAVEDATGDINHLCLLLRRLPPHVRMYAGMDEYSLPYLSVGAYGVASSSAQLAGRAMRRMIQDYLGGRPEAARETYLQLQELYHILMSGGLPGMLKEALTFLGFAAGAPRPPLLPPGESERYQLRRHLEVCRDRALLMADPRGGSTLTNRRSPC